MDARAFVVAALFGFIGGLLVPRQGDDRKAVLITLSLVTAIGIVLWLLADDPMAGPSMTIGGASAIVGAITRRFGIRRFGTSRPTAASGKSRI